MTGILQKKACATLICSASVYKLSRKALALSTLLHFIRVISNYANAY